MEDTETAQRGLGRNQAMSEMVRSSLIIQLSARPQRSLRLCGDCLCTWVECRAEIDLHRRDAENAEDAQRVESTKHSFRCRKNFVKKTRSCSFVSQRRTNAGGAN